MNVRAIRKFLAPLRRTPFHPQWFVSNDKELRQQQLHLLSGIVLDIGCSDRTLSSSLPASCHYIGLDYYTTVQSIYGTRPDVFGDASLLPIKNQSIDCVTLFEVLEHVPDPGATIAEIARVLRPGGILLLSAPFLYPIHDAPFDFHRFTQYALTRLMDKNNLEISTIKSRLRSFEVAGLFVSLALGDAAKSIVEKHRWAFLALLPIAVMVFLSNMSAWLFACLLPNSSFMPGGYELVAKRRQILRTRNQSEAT